MGETDRGHWRQCHCLLSTIGAHEAAHDFLQDVAGGFYEVANLAPDDYAAAVPLSGHHYFLILPWDDETEV